MANLNDLLRRNWFLGGVLCCIFLAEINPGLGARGGPLKPEITVKYFTVSLIFFISGISLRTNELTSAVYQVKLHCFIQIFTLLVVPVLMQIFVKCLSVFDINEWILKGLLTVSCMPPPVSSAVILTKAVGGNEAAAIFNSALGSLLGVIVTPLTLLYFLGMSTLVPLSNCIFQLAMTVIIPLALGQSARHVEFRGIRKIHRYSGMIGQISLLFIIYSTFCDTFAAREESGMSAHHVLSTIVLVVAVQIFLLYLAFAVASRLKEWFTPPDVVTILFCSTHKSLTLGVPMLRVLFGGYSHLAQISLPLLVYHPTQILLGGMLASQLGPWLRYTRSRRARGDTI
ncbi:sodium/bile acid cotransporter 7-like isoform X2 [Ischnura elegans]|uniref:sodium/bile acid cotransporter 7-like isoform X2 n=1 Tax=Ischnura elegans TaxID=197161 RepID=UPI001ED869D3|nr:sodium/bile acid cotransporter 7-like isoform X2 [Ischnura elegans]